ncbi:MAG: indole-3-glycerol phosphate synthase TrpC [Gammaproteobacteria bacterium]|nr:indole-3-glycerol phosphate synthase TrpC [Gammaproteobacteria bacterium]
MKSGSILDEILRVKRSEVADKQASTTLAEIRARANDQPRARGFQDALEATIHAGKPAIIAEIKKASPSRGVIRADLDVGRTAAAYAAGGAAALSVLTDTRFFQGSDAYVNDARNAARLPVLRKEFIIDPWQVYESRALQADCLLLIVAALSQSELEDLHGCGIEAGLDVLVEVHDEAELERALRLQAAMIGINNRNLHGFETHLDVTRRLAPSALGKRLVVAESGIKSADDIRALREIDVHAFLVGESLMASDDPRRALERMLSA